MSENNTEATYFDLTAEGLGYLNRARTVNPSQGSPYHCVTVAALHGNSDNPNYTYLDCKIVGSEALALVTEHFDAINDGDIKVLARCKAGDLVADSYVVTSGDNKGNRNHVIKARLLRITWLKIGDDVIDLGLDSTDSSASEPENSGASDDNAQGSNDANLSVNGEFGEVVCLSQDDPNFQKIRQELKDLGYRWVNDDKAWYSPSKFEALKLAA